MIEKFAKRTIYVAQCNCKPEDPFRVVKLDTPPREVLCPHCGAWIPFVEESYTGPDQIGNS